MYFNSSPVWQIIFLYIGSVIGAGFASGQEILQFFIVFGHKGMWGVIAAAVMFFYLGAVLMFLAVSLESTGYNEIYRILMGRTPARIMDILSMIMLPGGLVVMLSGGGAIFSEHLGLPPYLGTLLIAVITVSAVFFGLQGVMAANAVLVPIKVVFIVIICLYALTEGGFPALQPSAGLPGLYGFKWLWSAVLYVSYNMVVSVAVLSSLGRTVSMRSGITGGMLGGIALGALAGLIAAAGLCFYPEICAYEIPMLFIASSLGGVVKAVLGVVIWMAVLTTAIADAHGVASRFACGNSRKYKIIGTGVVLLALPLSAIKFSLLVKYLYPLFGYVGLLLLAALIFIPPVRLIRRKIFFMV